MHTVGTEYLLWTGYIFLTDHTVAIVQQLSKWTASWRISSGAWWGRACRCHQTVPGISSWRVQSYTTSAKTCTNLRLTSMCKRTSSCISTQTTQDSNYFPCRSHSRTRATIEQVNGQLKNKFRCLMGQGVQMWPDRDVIMAYFVQSYTTSAKTCANLKLDSMCKRTRHASSLSKMHWMELLGKS